MAAKRSKGGCKKKGSGGGPRQKRGTPRNTQKSEDAPAQNPYDRVAFVRPFWESLTEEQRVELLTVSLKDVWSQARDHADKAKALGDKKSVGDLQNPMGKIEPRVLEILEEGLGRIGDQSTWKVWRWGASGKPYTDAEVFRKDVEEEHIDDELRQLLPRDEGKAVEKPAEAALREKMTNLLGQIQAQLQSAQDAWRRGQRNVQDQVETVVRDGNIDLVIAILEALQQEHHCLYQTILTPVTEFVCSHLPVKNRKSSRTELFFEDLEKLPPEEVARLYEWLTEKVDSLCAKLKPDPKEEEVEEEQSVGDIDLFSLTADESSLTVNPKWLQHLQERLLSEEGQPRKVKEGEDPHRVGLVLEWVYGSIVSTAEKARDGAKRSLGSWVPTIKQAHENLVTALKDQRDWESRANRAKELLNAMVASRKDVEALETKLNIVLPGTSAGQNLASQTESLSGPVIIKVLKREELLTRAKLHVLQYERMMGDSQLRTLRAELMQGEPELERLKRELEEVKNTPRGLEGTFRTAAEKERHRAQLADSLLEEQLEVQSAFREQGAKLQGIYDKRQRTEIEMAKRDQEIKQLKSWQGNVNGLITRFEAALGGNSQLGDVHEAGSIADEHGGGASSSNAKKIDPPGLVQLRQTFNRDYRKQLYSDQDDHQFFNCIKSELKQNERRLEDGKVVLQHLEMFMINVACDDPGACIGGVLVLPILQDRLDKEALEFANHKASLAEEEVLRMEMENNEKVSAEVERKQKQKKKLKDKARLAKERKAAEQKAKEEAERARLVEQQIKEKERLEAERIKREVEMERLKKEEEELIEKRRLELLQEENGYWRLRMEAEDVSVPENEVVVAEPVVVPEEDNFQSVSNTRRRTHERRQQQPPPSPQPPKRVFHRRGSGFNGSSGPSWNSAPESPSRGVLPQHKRHKSADLESFNRRRPLSARGQPSDRQQPRNGPRSPSNRHPSSARGLQGRRSLGDCEYVARSAPTNSTFAGNTQNLPAQAAHTHHGTAPKGITPPASPLVNNEMTESCRNDVQPAAVEEGVNSDNSSRKGCDGDAAVASVQKAAWVKGSIPPEVLGHSRGCDAGKSDADDSKRMTTNVIAGQSAAATGSDKVDSVSTPTTPDSTEAEAPAPNVMSGSKVLQRSVHSASAGHSQQAVSQTKGTPPRESVVDEISPDSSFRGSDSSASVSNGSRCSEEELLPVARSASSVDEEQTETGVVGVGHAAEGHDHDNRSTTTDVMEDTEYQSEDESSTDDHAVPPNPMMAPPVGPPPFMMMGGPMGPLSGFHPGLFPHIRHVGPPMRPFVPMMSPPGYIRPPGVMPPGTSTAPACLPVHPQSPGQDQGSSSTQDVGVSSSTSASGQRGPPPPQALPPMYFYPSQMMQQGGPMMTPFMPLLPGQWFGFPMGPPQGPTFPPSERGPKKFALRPTAKEFIPPSMLAEGSSNRLDPIADDSECGEQCESDADVIAGIDTDAMLGSTGGNEPELRNAAEQIGGSEAESAESGDPAKATADSENDLESSFDVGTQQITPHGCEVEAQILDATKVVARTIEQEA